MEYNSVALLLTENCNAQCVICCDSRGVVRGDTMTIENLELLLGEISRCEQIKYIGVTGGEPMLYPNLVEKVIHYDYSRKMNVSLKTNGFWGNDSRKAEAFIAKASGALTTISLSFDDFHREFIDIECVKTIIDLANEYRINTEVTGCFLAKGTTPGDILNDLGQHAYKTKFVYQPVIRTGSAKDKFTNGDFLELVDAKGHEIKCQALLFTQLLINPRFDVFPCCSQVIENTILSFGNLKNQSLTEIIDAIMYNRIMHSLFTKGFKPFLDNLECHKIDYPQMLTSPCEMCEFLFSNPWFLDLMSHEHDC